MINLISYLDLKAFGIILEVALKVKVILEPKKLYREVEKAIANLIINDSNELSDYNYKLTSCQRMPGMKCCFSALYRCKPNNPDTGLRRYDVSRLPKRIHSI
jgi:hypothetical protein